MPGIGPASIESVRLHLFIMNAIMCEADTAKCTWSAKTVPTRLMHEIMLLEYCLLSTSQKSSYFTQFFEYMEILNIHFDQF